MIKLCKFYSLFCLVHAAFNDPSALLKHEVAYCLGQMQNVTALPHLERLLRNADENSMVRHEVRAAITAPSSSP